MPNKDDIVNQHNSSAAPDSVLELVHAVMHEYRSRQFQALRDGPHAVTHMQSKLLGFFARHPGASQRDLARHSGRDKAQLARLLAGLRAQGLLAGEVDPSDARSVRLSLTAQGEVVQRALRTQAKRLNTHAVAGLSAAEQMQLLALLAKVRGNLATAG